MELNERKIRILELIIKDYIANAEPVGSRTIAKKHGLGLSSATIRNEMSDLEELGYIVAPHASAGRVPSDKGYRLFVDRLLRNRASGQEGFILDEDVAGLLEAVITRNINRIDYLMRETAKAVSMLTNYTAVVSEAYSAAERLAMLQLMPMDETSVLLVTVTATKKVRNHIIRLNGQIPDSDELTFLSRTLLSAMGGKTSTELMKQEPPISVLLRQVLGAYHDTMLPVIAVICSVLNDGDGIQFYTSGIKNILAFPEFYDHEKARALFEALEEEDYLSGILNVDEQGISVVIGQENSLIQLKDCSVIKTSYQLDGDVKGGIALIGPTRMDYQQAVNVLQGMARHINGALRALESGELPSKFFGDTWQ